MKKWNVFMYTSNDASTSTVLDDGRARKTFEEREGFELFCRQKIKKEKFCSVRAGGFDPIKVFLQKMIKSFR